MLRNATTLTNNKQLSHKNSKILTIFIITFLSIIHLPAIATSSKLHQYKLANGLTLLVKEDHRAPVVMLETWYKVGGSYEPNGITGISHALEHMMFQGTNKYPKEKYSTIITNNGGKINAVTSADATYYYVEIDKNKLALALKLEADRMQNLSLKQDAFTKEIKVVKEERLMRSDNNPQNYTIERFNAAAFPNSPYHNPVIGWPGDLDHMNIQDLRLWYKTWYAPNNATIVVIGDIKAQQVYELVQKNFNQLKPAPLPTIKPFNNLTPVGPRSLIVKRPAKLPYLVMGYNTPSAVTTKQTWEAYALEVLTAILDSGMSSRLSKQLVRKQKIASSINANYQLYSRLPGLLTFTATPNAKHNIQDLKHAITEQIKLLQTTLVQEKELNRVKTQMLAEKTFLQDSISQQAYIAGKLQSIGLNWNELDNYFQQIQRITPQQLQAVANKYLIIDRLTTAILNPQPLSGESHASNAA